MARLSCFSDDVFLYYQTNQFDVFCYELSSVRADDAYILFNVCFEFYSTSRSFFS